MYSWVKGSANRSPAYALRIVACSLYLLLERDLVPMRRLYALYKNTKVPRNNVMEIRTKPTGKPVLYLNGYAYFRDNNKEDRIYWKCTRKKGACSARAVSLKEPDGTPVYASESNKCIQHDHPPNQKPLSPMVISGNVLHHDGFSYDRHVQNETKTRRFWRCQREGCKGLIISKLGDRGKALDANMISDHNHASDQPPCSKCTQNRKRRHEVIYASSTHECDLAACNTHVHQACGRPLERHGSQRSLVFCSRVHRNLFLQSTDDTPSAEPPIPARAVGTKSDAESTFYIDLGDSDGNADEGSGDDQQVGVSDTLGKKRQRIQRLVLSDNDEEEENPNSDEEDENPNSDEEDENPVSNDEFDASDGVSLPNIDDDQDMEDNDINEDRDMEEDRHIEENIFRKPTEEYAAPSASSHTGTRGNSELKPAHAAASTSSFDATNGKRYARPRKQATLADFQRPRTGQSMGVGSSERSDEDVPRAPPVQTHSVEPSTSSSGISAVSYAQDDAEGSTSGPAMPASRPDLRKAGVKRPAALPATPDSGGRERDGAEPDGDLHQKYFQSKIKKNDLIIEKTQKEMELMEQKRKQEETLYQLTVKKMEKEIELLTERSKRETEKAVQERERHNKLQEMSNLEATESKQRQAWYESCTRQCKS